MRKISNIVKIGNMNQQGKYGIPFTGMVAQSQGPSEGEISFDAFLQALPDIARIIMGIAEKYYPGSMQQSDQMLQWLQSEALNFCKANGLETYAYVGQINATMRAAYNTVVCEMKGTVNVSITDQTRHKLQQVICEKDYFWPNSVGILDRNLKGLEKSIRRPTFMKELMWSVATKAVVGVVKKVVLPDDPKMIGQRNTAIKAALLTAAGIKGHDILKKKQ